MRKIIDLIIGGACMFFSGITLSFAIYGYEPKQNIPELHMLEGISSYIQQQYEGENPKNVLEYVQKTLAIVRKNEKFREDVSKLEKEVKDIITEIGESENPSVYQPVLENIGKKIKNIELSYEEPTKRWSYIFSILLGIFGITNLAYAAMNRKD